MFPRRISTAELMEEVLGRLQTPFLKNFYDDVEKTPELKDWFMAEQRAKEFRDRGDHREHEELRGKSDHREREELRDKGDRIEHFN